MKTPWYRSPWFWILALFIAGIRIGYKMSRTEQPSSYESRLESINARNARLKEQLKTNEAASPATVVIADSSLLADSAAATR